jgi:hypothetical protein
VKRRFPVSAWAEIARVARALQEAAGDQPEPVAAGLLSLARRLAVARELALRLDRPA